MHINVVTYRWTTAGSWITCQKSTFIQATYY